LYRKKFDRGGGGGREVWTRNPINIRPEVNAGSPLYCAGDPGSDSVLHGKTQVKHPGGRYIFVRAVSVIIEPLIDIDEGRCDKEAPHPRGHYIGVVGKQGRSQKQKRQTESNNSFHKNLQIYQNRFYNPILYSLLLQGTALRSSSRPSFMAIVLLQITLAFFGGLVNARQTHTKISKI